MNPSSTIQTTSSSDEQILTSPFYQSLVDHIPNLEQDAAKYHWLLCIPQRTAIPPPHRLTLSMLQTHVLKPNTNNSNGQPKNEYITLSGKRIKKLNRHILQTIQPDFETETEIKILFDETFYLTDVLNYKCVLLEKPLIGAPKALCFDDGTEMFKEKRPQQEWWDIFSREAPEVIIILNELDNLVPTHTVTTTTTNQLSTNNRQELQFLPLLSTLSLLVPFSLIKERCQRVMKLLEYHPIFKIAWTESRYVDILSEGVQSCACSAAHATIFSSLCQHYAFAEKDFQLRMHDLRSRLLRPIPIQAEDEVLKRLGLAPITSSSSLPSTNNSNEFIDKAVYYLANMNEPRCALEKMWLIRDAIYQLRSTSTSADDMLPMLLKALCIAAPGLVLANMAYITDYLELDKICELAYHRTMLHGVVSVIQDHTVNTVTNPFDFLQDFKMFGGSSNLSNTSTSNRKSTTTTTLKTTNNTPDNPFLTFLKNINCVPADR
jgi:hypothetical protein